VRKIVGVVFATVVLGAGCAGDDGSDDVATTSTQMPSLLPEGVGRYVEMLGQRQPGGMEQMLQLSAEGSPAHLYARHHIASRRLMGGGAAATVEVSGERARSCGGMVEGDGRATDACLDLTGFDVDDEGLVVDFDVNGTPVGGRIVAGDPAGVSHDAGVTVTVDTALRTTAGTLVASLQVANLEGHYLDLVDDQWAYAPPDGAVVDEPAELVGRAADVPPGATSGVLAVFDQAALGGTLTFVARAVEGEEIRVEVPVPAPEATPPA
jgi:hypothetical protein